MRDYPESNAKLFVAQICTKYNFVKVKEKGRTLQAYESGEITFLFPVEFY